MSAFRASVERWRSLAESEVVFNKARFTPNLALAVVQQESGGKPGVKAYAKAGDGSYAMGLMQCIKSVTDDYNKTHGTSYDHESVMGGTSLAAAQIQLRVGIWLLNRKHAQVRNWLSDRIGGEPAHRDVTMLADTAYAMGWGATRKKLTTLQTEKLPLTFDALAERFPKWGWSEKRQRWINNPLKHARGTWSRYQAGEAEKPYGLGSEEGEGVDIEPTPEPPGEDPKGIDAPLPSDDLVDLPPDPEDDAPPERVGPSAVEIAVVLGFAGLVAGLVLWVIARS